MMRFHISWGKIPAALLAALLLAVGCASTGGPTIEFDAGRDVTRFASERILIGRVSMSAGLASGQRVTVQAFAACEGRDCEPEEYELAFYNDGERDLNLDYRRIRVSFGGRELDWEDAGRLDEPEHYLVPRGEFIRVPLSASDFRALADASVVEVEFGLTGTTRMTVPGERLEPLRELLQAMEAPV